MAHHDSCRRYRRIIEHRPAKTALRTTKHRWTPLKKRCLSSEEREKEEIVSKFQGILNKLTPQNFECLAEQAQSLDISTEEGLQMCINKLFLMVQLDSNNAEIYAHFCHMLFCIKEKVAVVNEKEMAIDVYFKNEIQSRCHRETEKHERAALMKAIEEATSEEEKEIKKKELIEWEKKSHKRSLASSHFFAQLFKLKLLSESAIREYIQYIVHLVCSTFDEEALESFCHLIKTIGKELDDSQTKECMDQYFECIAGVLDKKKISFHIRFMFQDILKLRKNKWGPQSCREEKTDQCMLLTGQEDISVIEHGLVSSGQDVGGQRDSVPDVTRIIALSRSHKKKGHAVPILGPRCTLPPRSWKRPQTPVLPSDPDFETEKERVPQTRKVPELCGASGSKQQAIPTQSDSDELLTPTEALPKSLEPSKQKPANKLYSDTREQKTLATINELSREKMVSSQQPVLSPLSSLPKEKTCRESSSVSSVSINQQHPARMDSRRKKKTRRSKKKTNQKILLASQLTGLSGSLEFELDTTRLINPSPQSLVQNDISDGDDETQGNSSDVPVIPGQQYKEFKEDSDECDIVHGFTLQQEMQPTLCPNFQQTSTSHQQQFHRENSPQQYQQQINSPEVTPGAQHREGTPQAPQQVYTAEVPQQSESAPQAPQQPEATPGPHREDTPQVSQQMYTPETPTNPQHGESSSQAPQQLQNPEVLVSSQQPTLRDHILQPTPITEESPRVPATPWQQAHIPQGFANPSTTWQNDHPESMHFQIQQPVYSHQQSDVWDCPQVPVHTQQPLLPQYVSPQNYRENNYYQTHSHYFLPQPNAQDPAVYGSIPSFFSYQMLSSPQSRFYMNTFQPNNTPCPPQSYMFVQAPCSPLLHMSNGPSHRQQLQYMNIDPAPLHQQFYPNALPGIPPHQTYMSAPYPPLLYSHAPHQQAQYMNTNIALPRQQFLSQNNHSPTRFHIPAPHPPLLPTNIGPPPQQRPINPFRRQAQYRPRKTNPVPPHRQPSLLDNHRVTPCQQSYRIISQIHPNLANVEDNLVCVLLSKDLFDHIQLSYLGPERYQPTDQPLCQPGQVVDKQDSGNVFIVRYPSNNALLTLHVSTVTRVTHTKDDRVMVVNSEDLVYQYHGMNATRFCGKLGAVKEVSVRGVVVSIDNREISFNPFCLMPVSDDAICVICDENLHDVVMDCCSQQVMCSKCLDKLAKPECPFCRCPIQQRTEFC